MNTDENGYRIFEKPYSQSIDYLLLGDGVIAGWAYPNQDTLEYQINELLVYDTSHMKVLNLAVPGYGTIQQYLQLENFLNMTDYNIKNVVLLFNSDNDFFNNSQIMYGLPFFKDNKFNFAEKKYLNFFNEYFTFFYTYRFLQNIKSFILESVFNRNQVLKTFEYNQDTINNTKQILDMMKNILTEKNINFYIIILGNNCKYIEGYCLKDKSSIKIDTNEIGHFDINSLKKLSQVIMDLK